MEQQMKANETRKNITAYLIMGLLSWVVIHVLIYGVPKMDEAESLLVGTLVGAVVTYSGRIIGYDFGSTQSSKDKTEVINDMAKKDHPTG